MMILIPCIGAVFIVIAVWLSKRKGCGDYIFHCWHFGEHVTMERGGCRRANADRWQCCRCGLESYREQDL